MPITVHDDEALLYDDPEHWEHVMMHLFEPAILAAGFDPIRPSASGTSMIHARIVKQLVEADLVLCDLSQHNPNVLFELGVRTSLDRPVALVKDEHLRLPFDIQGLNTHEYASRLDPWVLERQIEALSAHIVDTVEASQRRNPLWEHFGVAIAATSPASDASPLEANVQLILERLDRIEQKERSSSDDLGAGLSEIFQRRIANLIVSAPVAVEGVSMSPDAKGRGLSVRVMTPKSDAEVQRGNALALRDHVAARGFAVRIQHSDPSTVHLIVLSPGDPDTARLVE